MELVIICLNKFLIKELVLEIVRKYYFLFKVKLYSGYNCGAYIFDGVARVWGNQWYIENGKLPFNNVRKIGFGADHMMVLAGNDLHCFGNNEKFGKLNCTSNVRTFFCAKNNFIIVDNDNGIFLNSRYLEYNP